MVEHARPHAPIAARPATPIQPAPFVDAGLEARKAQRSHNAALRMKPRQNPPVPAAAIELFPLPTFDSEPIAPARAPAPDSWPAIADSHEHPSPFSSATEQGPRRDASRAILPAAAQSPLAARLAALHKSRQNIPREPIRAPAANTDEETDVVLLRAQIEAAARSRMKPKARVPLLTEIARSSTAPLTEAPRMASVESKAAPKPAVVPPASALETPSALPVWAKSEPPKKQPHESEDKQKNSPWLREPTPKGFIAAYGYYLSRHIGAPLMLLLRNAGALAFAFLHIFAPAALGWIAIRSTAHGQDILLAGGYLFAGIKMLWAYFAFSFAWTTACMGAQSAYAYAKAKIEVHILIR